MKNRILSFVLLVSCMLMHMQAQIDPSFGVSGKLIITPPNSFGYKMSGLKTDADGSLYVYATQYSGNGSDVVIQKLLVDGSPDPSYGVNGRTLVDVEANDHAAEILQLPHGKMLLVGYGTADGNNRPFVARLTASGTPDGAPMILANAAIPDDIVITAAVLTSRSQYLLAGHATNPHTGNKDFIVLLVDKVGQLVPNFGTDGLVWVDFVGAKDIAQHLLLRKDGSILVTGYSEKNAKEQYAMASLSATGKLIASFGASGRLNLTVGTTGLDRAFEAYEYGGKILIAGYSRAGTRDVVSMVQMASHTGLLDKQFDFDGKRLLYIAGKNDRAYHVIGTQDGALYVSGLSQQYDYSYHPVVIKVNANGSTDESFGMQGVLRIATAVSEESSQHGMVIQGFTKPLIAHTSMLGQGLVLARVMEASANSAGFTAVAQTPLCEGTLKLIPQHLEGVHQWIFEEPYGAANTSEASPTVKFWKAGFHKVKHVYTSPEGLQQIIEQVCFVDKAPVAYTNQYDIVPYAWPTTLYGYSERNFYATEGNTFTYSWEHMGHQYGNVGSIRETYPQAGFYPVSFTVTREATYEDLCPTATVHDTIIVTEMRENCNGSDNGEDLGPQVSFNQVINGDFENADCPATTFKSDFQQQCNTSQAISPEQIAIVTSNGSKVLRQVEKAYEYNPFLLIGRYSHVLNRDIWAQEVQVQQGQVYQFFADVLNYSYEVEGDYSFPKLTFAVDDAPVLTTELVSGVRHMCATYKATKTGIVNLRVLKSNGVYFSDGTVELDNIVFGPALNEVAARKASEDQEIGVSLSPNPAVGHLTVNSGGAVASQLALFNGLGALVMHQNLDDRSVIALTDVDSGIYIAHIYGEDGKLLKSEKLVVQK